MTLVETYSRAQSTPRSSPAALWLAIRLPSFSLESLGIDALSELPIMIAHKNKVCAATQVVLQKGVTLGMPVSTAHCLNSDDQCLDNDTTQAESPPWRTYAREHNSEEKKLKQLCDAFYNITPYIQQYITTNDEGIAEFGILLEVSRCLRLFKSFTAIVEQVQKLLQEAQVHYVLGQAHSAMVAWLLSYTEQDLQADASRELFLQQLAPLPLALLYEHKDTVAKLEKSGFFIFADLIRQVKDTPLRTLTQRFGEKFSAFIMDALGIHNDSAQVKQIREASQLYQPDERFCDSVQFDYPIDSCEQLQHPMQTLLHKLSHYLVKHQRQTQAIVWQLYDIYQNQDSLPVHLERLHRDIQLALELSMIQLEGKSLAFAVDTLELRCDHSLPVDFTQQQFSHRDLFAYDNDSQTPLQDPQEHRNALAITAAKLAARLGDKALYTLSAKDSHIPELSFSRKKFKTENPKKPATPPSTSSLTTDRPSWIFNTPYSIGTRQNALHWKGRLELLQGPERIEGLWWKKPTARDYFVAQRDDDVRLWVFFDCYKDEWFVHGVFA